MTISKAEKARKEAERDEAIAKLRKLAPKGARVYGVVRHVSRTGMSRTIDFYTINGGDLMYLTGYIADVLGWGRTKEGALKVSGCGMDMIFHTVYNTARAVHDDGYAWKHDSI